MKIIKQGETDTGGKTDVGELAAVNTFAKTKLRDEDVYLFSVLLCDNEVDRDFERFSEGTLKELGELFVGATGICDHEWKSGNQVARIYRTELITDPTRKNRLGMPYEYLKGRAYMLRTEENRGLISEIQGGIKKETSVGCSISKSVCSICGEELGSAACSHIKGREYGGKLCYGELSGAVDAYEWSFVAVPAQKNAGVIKKLQPAGGLKGFIDSDGGSQFSGEFMEMQKSAALGRKYIKTLSDEVLRLCLACDRGWYDALKGAVGAMDEQGLLAVKAALEKKSLEKYPATAQLPGQDRVTAFDGSEYQI